MGKSKIILALIVVAGLAAVMVWQNTQNESLRRDNDGLKLQLAELKQLSDAPGPAAANATFSPEQRDELLKLRAEVTQLRVQTNQIGELKEANQKLQVSLREARTPRPGGAGKNEKKPEDALPQDIHPKESWAFRGYGSPEATIESTCWGLLNGDKAVFLTAFSPEMLPKMEKQLEGKDFAKESEDAKKENMAEFRILDRRQLSDDQMVLTIYMARRNADGTVGGNSENTVFQRVGGEWKVTDKRAPEN